MIRASRHRFPLLCFIVAVCAAVPAATQEKKTLKPEDYARWEQLGPSRISPDGKWVCWQISREGEGELKLRSAAGGETKSYAQGQGAVFSPDSKWLGFSIGFSEAEREKMEKAKKPIQNKLGLVDLASLKLTTIENVAAFSFSDKGGALAMRRYPVPGRTSKGADLIVRDLSSGTDTTFGNVATFAWRKDGRLLAMTIDAEGKTGNGVQLFDPQKGTLRTLDSSDSSYVALAWRRDADDLAVLRTAKDEKFEGEGHVLVAWRGLDGDRPERKVYEPSKDPSFPPNTRLVDFRNLSWSRDGSLILVGTGEWEAKPQKPGDKPGDKPADKPAEPAGGVAGETKPESPKPADKPAAKKPDDEPAKVDVWHPNDPEIIPAQKLRLPGDKRRSLAAAWHVDTGKLVVFGKDLDEDAGMARGRPVLIVEDPKPYQKAAMFGPSLQDVYVVDAATGARTLVVKGIEFGLGASPNGRYYLFLRDNQYFAYDLQDRKEIALTKGLAASFVNVEDDHTVKQKPPFGIAGWTKDDRSVIVYDKYDMWELFPGGDKARRLTDGAKEAVVHRYVSLDPDADAIDTSRPLMLSITGEWSKKDGYGRVTPGQPAERLVWLDKNVGQLAKAKEADAYLYVVQDVDDSPDVFVGGPNLDGATQVSQTNAAQKEFAWTRSELIDYKAIGGKRLQGALFYPADFDPAKKYPMVVYAYEKLSDMLHAYSAPNRRDPYNIGALTQRGYFVLTPDIAYRDRDPGLSAEECITTAVNTVLSKAPVDSRRIGMMGHSWGGYETAFMATKSDLFATAIAGAPLTDLISMYLSVYWNSGSTDARIFEISQGRMEVPFWMDPEKYRKNSPLYYVPTMKTPLLVAFGDKDGAVDWHQGIELYNAARRAGKPVVMLVYEGENHGLASKPVRIDYSRRVSEWLDHYLQGKPAPDWITKGMPALQRDREIEKRKAAESPAASSPGQ